jgi:hypothetical protein
MIFAGHTVYWMPSEAAFSAPVGDESNPERLRRRRSCVSPRVSNRSRIHIAVYG